MQQLTSIDLFFNHPVNNAFVHCSRVLRLQRRTIYVTRIVKSTLQSIIFPAKEIIAVVRVARPAARY